MIFDLQKLRQEFERAKTEREDGVLIKRIYLGSILDLLPSGKFYMPWACSNVNLAEVEQDQWWFMTAEREVARLGAFLENGLGDPTDLFAVQVVV